MPARGGTTRYLLLSILRIRPFRFGPRATNLAAAAPDPSILLASSMLKMPDPLLLWREDELDLLRARTRILCDRNVLQRCSGRVNYVWFARGGISLPGQKAALCRGTLHRAAWILDPLAARDTLAGALDAGRHPLQAVLVGGPSVPAAGSGFLNPDAVTPLMSA